MIDPFVPWALCGLVSWVFGAWYWKIDLFGSFEWTYWLMIVPACVAGPFTMIAILVG